MFAHVNFLYVWVMVAPMITTTLSRKNYRSTKIKTLVQILNAVIGAVIAIILLFVEFHARFLQLACYWTRDFSDSPQNSELAIVFMLTLGFVFGLALGLLFEVSEKRHRNSVQCTVEQPQATPVDRPICISHLSAQDLAQAMLEEWGQLEKPEAEYR